MRANFTFSQLFDHVRKLRPKIAIVGKLDRANARRSGFHIRSQCECIMKQDFIDQFFLRLSACFYDQTQTASQALTRCHAFVHASLFGRLIELNDHCFFVFVIDERDWFCTQLGLMTQSGL